MSTLADFLIELSNPANLQRFRADPNSAMAGAGLSELDRKALRSGDVRLIQVQSQSGAEAGAQFAAATVPAILNGVVTLPPVVIVWPPPRWTAGYLRTRGVSARETGSSGTLDRTGDANRGRRNG